jgi:hypothetical protein
MISSEFTHAMGMKMFELECPIGLQLACIGSKSTISYGTKASITFGTRTVNEYFDVANVDFYDTILGTPFLRWHGILLDFRDQGKPLIGNELIPTNLEVSKLREKSGNAPQGWPWSKLWPKLLDIDLRAVSSWKTTQPNIYPNKGNGETVLLHWQNNTKKENNKNTTGRSDQSARQLLTVKPNSGGLASTDCPWLWEQWFEKFSGLFGEVPLELPPFREVNHEINLVDKHKQINYRLPKCPNQFKGALMEKIQRYTTAGCWVPATAKQAIPMLSTPKKNRTLRTVFDMRLQNENIKKDVNSFPDQDTIWNDVARVPYR